MPSRRLPPPCRARVGGRLGEGGAQAAADGGFARRVGDLVAEQVGHVEDVDGALAERRDMRRGDVEIEIRDLAGEVVEQARAVEAGGLDDRELVRRIVVDQDVGLEREGLEARLLLGLLGDMLGNPQRPRQRLLDQLADPSCPPFLVGLVVKFATDRDRVRAPGRRWSYRSARRRYWRRRWCRRRR